MLRVVSFTVLPAGFLGRVFRVACFVFAKFDEVRVRQPNLRAPLIPHA